MKELLKSNVAASILISYEDSWLATLYKVSGYRCTMYYNSWYHTFAAHWQDYQDTPEIVCGKAFLENFFGEETVNTFSLRPFIEECIMLFKALLCHEGGHIKYTPFAEFFDIVNIIRNSTVRNFLASGFNVVEDPLCENKVMLDHADANVPIMYLRKRLFDDKKEFLEQVTEQVATAPNSPETFLNYLLLKLRSHHVLPAYDMYDKHKEFIDESLSLIEFTLEKELRAKRAIAFLYEILKMLSGEEPNIDEVDKPSKIIPRKGIDGDGPEIPVDFDSSKIIRSVLEKESDEDRERTYTHKGTDCSEPIPDDVEIPLPSVSDMVKDTLSNPSLSGRRSYPHKFIVVKDKVNPKKFLDSYSEKLKYLSKHSIISPIVNSWRHLENKCLAQVSHYRTSGKLDMQTAHQPYNYKPFKVVNKPFVKEDTVQAHVLDYSGSMFSADKQFLAGHSAIACAEASNLMNMPFGIFAFTESSGTCYTNIFKDFDEPYNSMKGLLASYADGERLSGVPHWNGNIDEVNIGYIVTRLLERPEKNKILIVYSDGETCGDEETLKNLIKEYESQGVYTFGVGVRDEAVSRIYEHHIILENKEDLKRVPEEINKFVSTISIRQGGDK